MSLWVYLIMFILGCIIFEVATPRLINESDRKYGSTMYFLLLSATTGGLALALNSILKIIVTIEKQLEKPL